MLTPMLLWIPLAVLAIAATPPELAGGRFVFRDVQVNRATHRVAVWLPPGHTPKGRWPGIVFLHGSGECGTDGEKPTHVGLGPALRARPDRWPYVVVFPQKPRDDEEWEEREGIVLAALDDARRAFGLDSARVALGGMSQGGHGTWMIGARHPDLWACLFPICGYGRGRTVAPRVARLPVWAFHGLRDDVVDPADTRHIVQWIRDERSRLGLDPAEARMTLFPEANHNSWDPALAHDSLAVWLAQRLGAPPPPR